MTPTLPDPSARKEGSPDVDSQALARRSLSMRKTGVVERCPAGGDPELKPVNRTKRTTVEVVTDRCVPDLGQAWRGLAGSRRARRPSCLSKRHSTAKQLCPSDQKPETTETRPGKQSPRPARACPSRRICEEAEVAPQAQNLVPTHQILCDWGFEATPRSSGDQDPVLASSCLFLLVRTKTLASPTSKTRATALEGPSAGSLLRAS